MNRHSRRARVTILTSILLLVMNIGFPEGEVSVTPVTVEATRSHDEYLTQRDEALWERVRTLMAQEMGIRDPALAQTVAQAVEDAAGEFNVDPWLMVNLIRVESYGNPSAVSYVGAIGLTQIMPGTGHEIAGMLQIDNYETAMLYDPVLNVRFGTAYLRYLLDKFDGDLHASLAAYNWGPTNIAKRIRKREALPVQYPGKILRRTPEQPEWVLASAR